MSRGKRVVLATHGTLGDVHPFLALALELKRRGHMPVLATSQYHRAKIEAAGVPFHPLRPDLSYADKKLYRRLTEPRRGLERVIREYMLPVLRQTYDDLLSIVQAEGGADLLVSQILIFAAPLVAEKTGTPWVSTELQPGAFMSAYDPPVLAPLPSLARLRWMGPAFHRTLFAIAKQMGSSWGEPVQQLREELRLPRSKNPIMEGRHSPELVLALFSSLLGPPQPDWPPNTVVTGFPFYDDASADLAPELASFLDAGEPPVLFTLGSSAVWDAGSFYRESLNATQMLGVRGVLLIGDDPVNRVPQPLPENLIALPYAPFAQVFPRVSVVVHQGGVGTVGQTLRAGKPMLIMPFGADQFDNAARMERLAVGRTIGRRQYTAARAAKGIQHLLSGSYRKEALAVSERLKAENGAATAVEALERIAQRP